MVPLGPWEPAGLGDSVRRNLAPAADLQGLPGVGLGEENRTHVGRLCTPCFWRHHSGARMPTLSCFCCLRPHPSLQPLFLWPWQDKGAGSRA